MTALGLEQITARPRDGWADAWLRDNDPEYRPPSRARRDVALVEALAAHSIFCAGAVRFAPRRRHPGAMFDPGSLAQWTNHKNPRWRHLLAYGLAAHFGQMSFRHPSFGVPDELWRDALDERYQRRGRRWWGKAPAQGDFWQRAAGWAV